MSDRDVSESNTSVACSLKDVDEPPTKKLLMVSSKSTDSQLLEHRLEIILRCAVCLDLPHGPIYQCCNGHLICAGCFLHVHADSQLRDENVKCPTCRVELTDQKRLVRNWAAENALSELPIGCKFCSQLFPRKNLPAHESQECTNRPTSCKYQKIGCCWRGPFHAAWEHECSCSYPTRSGAEIMETVKAMDAKEDENRRLLDNIFNLLSFQSIHFKDLQLRPYRADEFSHKLFYETSYFTAGNNQWVVKAQINSSNNTKTDPWETNERKIMYQICLKTLGKPKYPIKAHYVVVRGPFGDVKSVPKIYEWEFTESESDSQFLELPLQDTSECNRLLSMNVINFRLLIFVVES